MRTIYRLSLLSLMLSERSVIKETDKTLWLKPVESTPKYSIITINGAECYKVRRNSDRSRYYDSKEEAIAECQRLRASRL